jgi:type IV secretion system protein VirD4
LQKTYRTRLGYWDKTFAETLWYPGEAHGLLCAPTRGGKFRDVLAQILLSWEGSCFIVDPKGQAAAVTARYRKEVLGQDVCVLNPFNILPDYLKDIRHAQYDPLTSKLDSGSPSFAADADNLAEGLMPYGGPETHWIDSARVLCSGVAMHLCAGFTGVNLARLYRVIAGPDLIPFCADAVEKPKADFVTEKLGRFREVATDDREIRSVISTAITQLTFMGNKPIADNLSASTVDFREMRKRPMTVYLILPGRYLASSAKWFRLITNSWADSCLEEGRGSIPVLGILDEFKSAVGKLGSIETLLALGAGYGCQLLTVIQDIPSLQELYPKAWETFIANSGWRMFFRPRDWTTSDFVSRMVGTTEVHTIAKSLGPKPSVSAASQGKLYLLPEEVRDLSDDEMLVFADGIPGVIRAGRRPYYDKATAEFSGKYDPDPYHPTG